MMVDKQWGIMLYNVNIDVDESDMVGVGDNSGPLVASRLEARGN
jgi:hypothetical protein